MVFGVVRDCLAACTHPNTGTSLAPCCSARRTKPRRLARTRVVVPGRSSGSSCSAMPPGSTATLWPLARRRERTGRLASTQPPHRCSSRMTGSLKMAHATANRSRENSAPHRVSSGSRIAAVAGSGPCGCTLRHGQRQGRRRQRERSITSGLSSHAITSGRSLPPYTASCASSGWSVYLLPFHILTVHGK